MGIDTFVRSITNFTFILPLSDMEDCIQSEWDDVNEQQRKEAFFEYVYTYIYR